MVIELKPRAGRVSVRKTDIKVANEGQADVRGPVHRRLCLICKVNAPSYSCPRCALPYCSAGCYKQHNQGCTESFYRRHVESEMRLRQAGDVDPQANKSLADALRKWRGHGGEAGDDMNEAEAERLLELAEMDELSLDELSEDEKKRFMSALASGELGREVQIWRPWWEVPMGPAGVPLVAEVDSAEPSVPTDEDGSGVCIDLRALLTQVSSVPGIADTVMSRAAPPSPLLRYHVLDILFAYCYTARVYNGCWRVDPPNACAELMALSTVLSNPTMASRVESASVALSGSLSALRRREQAGPGLSAMGLALVEDVAAVMRHKAKVMCALIDVFNLLRATVTALLEDGKRSQERDRGQSVNESAHLPMLRLESLLDLEVHRSRGTTGTSPAPINEPQPGEADLDVQALSDAVASLSTAVDRDKSARQDMGSDAHGGADRAQKPDKHARRVVREATKFLMVLYKLRYFLCWAWRQDDGVYEELIREVAAVKAEHDAFLVDAGVAAGQDELTLTGLD